jgi:hypothetical protein
MQKQTITDIAKDMGLLHLTVANTSLLFYEEPKCKGEQQATNKLNSSEAQLIQWLVVDVNLTRSRCRNAQRLW